MNTNELFYAVIPHSLNNKLVEKRVQPEYLKPLGIYPKKIKISSIPLDKCISFMPYCAKPDNCPMNKNNGRKNQDCLKLDGKKCKVDCSIHDTLDVLMKNGFTKDRIFIIDSDPKLFEWLKQKKNEGYEYYFAGIGCRYSVNYALNIVKKIGFKGGLISFVDGDDCKCMKDYLGMENGDKGRHTYISQESIKKLEYIFKMK